MTESTRSRAQDGIRKAFRQIAPEVDLDTVDPNTELREQVDMDSVDAINLLVLLDETLGVGIPEADYDRITTLEGMIQYLEARLPSES